MSQQQKGEFFTKLKCFKQQWEQLNIRSYIFEVFKVERKKKKASKNIDIKILEMIIF